MGGRGDAIDVGRTVPGWVPDAGDIVWLRFDPQAGPEEAGHRPAVVLSPAGYNGRAGMIVCCPTTTRIEGYPFEVVLAGTPPSAVLADQVEGQDWRARHAILIGLPGLCRAFAMRVVNVRVERTVSRPDPSASPVPPRRATNVTLPVALLRDRVSNAMSVAGASLASCWRGRR